MDKEKLDEIINVINSQAHDKTRNIEELKDLIRS